MKPNDHSHARAFALAAAMATLVLAPILRASPAIAQLPVSFPGPSLMPAGGIPQLTLAVIEPIQGLEIHGQVVRETLRMLDRTSRHVIQVPAGTEARMNRGFGPGGFDSSSFRQAGAQYALHAVAGPSVTTALMYSFNRDEPDLSLFPQFTWTRRISEVVNGTTNQIAAFVQQGTQCLLLARSDVVLPNQAGTHAIPTSGFFPHPEKNRWVRVATVLNTAACGWTFHHGDYLTFPYVLVQGVGGAGEENGPAFPIRVDSVGNCYVTRGDCNSILTCSGVGFWLNLDN